MEASAGAVAGLPDHVLVEILSRVPPKSACRFKCVSKAWRDLIADPYNRQKLPQPMEGIFYTCMTTESYEVEGMSFPVDCFGFCDLVARSVPLDIDPCFFLTELPGIQILALVDSCNGLVLFAHRERQDLLDDTLGYVVCNPTTKQWRAVPASGCPLALVPHIYLSFDPAASPHFHLVELEFEEKDEQSSLLLVHAYSSETGTWCHNLTGEQEEEKGRLEAFPIEDTYAAFVNGILHLIVYGSAPQFAPQIVAVDVQGKTRKVITVPDIGDERRSYVCFFGQSQGQLHCITKGVSYVGEEIFFKLSIWVLQDYDTQEWMLKDTLSSLELSLFGDKSCKAIMPDFQVVDIHQDRNVVFFTPFSRDKLVAYDMERREASIIAICGKQNRMDFVNFARHVPYFSESPALTIKQLG